MDPGWLCTTPGAPCSRFAVCGDGVVAFPEQCDDGDPLRVGGDGCSENCKLEIGYKCEGTPSVCSETTCGDDIVEGAEMCEPNLDDSCTAECQFAPQCDGTGPCTSTCGDGLKLGEGEDCDDGNNLPGNGCSPDCKIEPGYSCAATAGECQTDANGTCIQRVPVVFRNFDYNHPNFGGVEKDQCDTAGISTGAVQTALTGGKPVTTNSVACTDKLSEWYTDTEQSTRHNDTLILYQNDEGNYVYRWGANGEQFTHPTNNFEITQGWCGNGTECSECTLAADEKCFSPCPQGGGTCAGRDVAFDGNPFFFPVDGIVGAKDNGGEAAAVSDEGLYGGTGPGVTELVLTSEGPEHNFSFTTEIAYWFTFEADDPATEVNEATNASFEFVGDDDVWVFVNGQLAVDLGGKHADKKGEFTLDGNAPTFGMETGNVYEIKVFHAERQAIGSTFKLTLSGFNTSRSDCVAECGNGIIGFGEQCDNGAENIEAGTAVYSGCNTECRLEGGFCGNGIVDTEAGGKRAELHLKPMPLYEAMVVSINTLIRPGTEALL